MYFLIILLQGLVLSGFGQSQNPSSGVIPKVMPSTPEVAALAKFIDIPMGYSTGTPVINIPIHSIGIKDVSIPISLNYNTSGIRVDEAATWVGLGWNLNLGGNISRIVKSAPDELSYMNTTKTTEYLMNEMYQHKIAINTNNSNNHMSSCTCTQTEEDLANNILDAQPDVFMFNLLGYSGKFTWNQLTHQFDQTPFSNVKIEYSTDNDWIKSFKLILPNGVKAYYGISKDGLRVSNEYNNPNNITTYFDGNSSQSLNVGYSYITGWSLLSIENSIGETIEFEYESVLAKNFGRMSEMSVMGTASSYNNAYGQGCAPITGFNLRASFFNQNIIKPIILSISTKETKVVFSRSNSIREDVFINERSLEKISIYTFNDKFIKRFKFTYDYLLSNDSTSLWGLEAYSNTARKRLRLLRLQEVDSNDSGIIPAYKFSYTLVALPNRLSASQDYWGYFNGKIQYNNFLTPKTDVTCIQGYSGLPYKGLYHNENTGADRTIDTSLCYAGILKKIEYPTGGFTEYFYESNQAPLLADAIVNCVERSGLLKRDVYFGMQNNTPTYYYSQNFTIASGKYGVVKMTSDLQGCLQNMNSSCRISITLEGISDPTYQNTFSMSGIQYLNLISGEYKISATIDPNPNNEEIPFFNVHLTWKEQVDPYNFPIGGLRVKKIISSDNIGNTIKRSFSYNLFINDSVSSGFLTGIPTHVINTFFEPLTGETGNGGFLTKVVSNSHVPLSEEGRTIIYSNVKEYYDDQKESFKNEYKFSVDFDGYSEGFQELTTKKTWRDGLLINKKSYIKTDNNYLIVNEENNEFGEFDTSQYRYAFVYSRENIGVNCNQMQLLNNNCFFRSEWYLPISTTTKNYSYDANGNQKILSSTLTNTYNSKHFIAKTTTTNSEGKLIENNIWYPDDYNNIGYNLDQLKTKNIIQNPIKQETWVNNKIKSGNIILYNANGQPESVYNYENNLLINPPTHDPNTILNNNYNLKHNINYFADGNVKELLKTNDIPECYFWGYNNQYPVAKVIGKPYDVVLSLSGIDINILNNPNTTDIAMRTELAKLRNVSDCLVTSYTYKPLVGITSETDPQGKTIYYEYDSFNRLKLIRDKDNNILKTFDYKYQQQQN